MAESRSITGSNQAMWTAGSDDPCDRRGCHPWRINEKDYGGLRSSPTQGRQTNLQGRAQSACPLWIIQGGDASQVCGGADLLRASAKYDTYRPTAGILCCGNPVFQEKSAIPMNQRLGKPKPAPATSRENEGGVFRTGHHRIRRPFRVRPTSFPASHVCRTAPITFQPL